MAHAKHTIFDNNNNNNNKEKKKKLRTRRQLRLHEATQSNEIWNSAGVQEQQQTTDYRQRTTDNNKDEIYKSAGVKNQQQTADSSREKATLQQRNN